MQLGILGGAGADGLQVLVVAMPATRTLKAMVEQPPHNLLIIGNMPIGVEPEDMGLAGAVLVGDGEGRMAHGSYSMCFRCLSRSEVEGATIGQHHEASIGRNIAHFTGIKQGIFEV